MPARLQAMAAHAAPSRLILRFRAYAYMPPIPGSAASLNSRSVQRTARQRWHLTGASSLSRSG
jgi:hypothetical protein